VAISQAARISCGGVGARNQAKTPNICRHDANPGAAAGIQAFVMNEMHRTTHSSPLAE
jgi:hypothetical protein